MNLLLITNRHVHVEDLKDNDFHPLLIINAELRLIVKHLDEKVKVVIFLHHFFIYLIVFID